MSNPAGASPRIPDLVLANPTAGGGLANEALPLLEKFAAERHWQVNFRSAGSSAEFTQIAREEARQGRTRIFALGGDGTFQVLLNAVYGQPGVSVGVLPAGGGNDLASALGLPFHPVQAAKAILENGEARAVDAARVHTADGVERLYMGGGGVGLDAEAARFASGVYRKIRGRGRYLLSAIRALRGFQPLGLRVTFDGPPQQSIETTALVAGVLNTPSYGAGLRLAPGANLEDGMLDLAVLAHLNWTEILKILPALAVTGEIHTRKIQRFLIRHVRIETDRPCMFHGDGELIGQTPVEITVVPGAMKVWRACRNAPQA